MKQQSEQQPSLEASKNWWHTDIIDIAPGSIRMRGYAIEDLIGRIGFPDMIWLMVRGDLPTRAQGSLFEAALVSAVDHGPQAPSIAIARMAATCGVGINGAMASAVNSLGDIHGGAGQQCMSLYSTIASHLDNGMTLERAAAREVAAHLDHRMPIPGFGHRFHPVDPRSVRLLELVDKARSDNVVSGLFAQIGRAVEDALAAAKGKRLPMNIDGATAVIYSELGFAPELGRGLFVLSRSVGILSHAWEQSHQGERIKGPMPRSVPYAYTGVPPRRFEGLPE